MLAKSIIKYLKKKNEIYLPFIMVDILRETKKYVSTCIQIAVESDELHYFRSKFVSVCMFFYRWDILAQF